MSQCSNSFSITVTRGCRTVAFKRSPGQQFQHCKSERKFEENVSEEKSKGDPKKRFELKIRREFFSKFQIDEIEIEDQKHLIVDKFEMRFWTIEL